MLLRPLEIAASKEVTSGDNGFPRTVASAGEGRALIADQTKRSHGNSETLVIWSHGHAHSLARSVSMAASFARSSGVRLTSARAMASRGKSL
jgi:hypothetical protein